MFGSPADGNVGFEYAHYYCTVECVNCKSGKFQTECSLSASCAGYCIEKNHCSDCEKVSAAHHDK